ncbi:MAG: methionyl-tRNA formyltransferase [Desulfobacteraceae bacterium 4572_19]|nr:MAG: methionyl-tRNA formyltransferase [Desulfobacteraceae bacterium 4572_19]
MKKQLNIIFMGTPDFAVPALKAIHNSGCNIPLVVTQPDRPKGRGKKMISPPVKIAALKLGLNVIQPKSVNTDEFFQTVKLLNPDIFVVVAFGQILKKNILELPFIAAVNIHASLLPKYRGAAPIQWIILNGEKETGVTTMKMDTGLDTGDILLSSKIKIQIDETAETLHDKLSNLGADLIIETITGFENNLLKPTTQDHDNFSYAPMLSKKDGQIDWHQSADKIDAFVRGMTKTNSPVPGEVIPGFQGELCISTGKGVLSILEIQGASGKRLKIEDFLRGFKMPEGSILHRKA